MLLAEVSSTLGEASPTLGEISATLAEAAIGAVSLKFFGATLVAETRERPATADKKRVNCIGLIYFNLGNGVDGECSVINWTKKI